MDKIYPVDIDRTAQLRHMIAEGIGFYDDPGHGWIVLSPARLREMEKWNPELLQESSFYRKGQRHFEEDVEISRVILAFPELFDPQSVDAASQALHAFHPEIYNRFMHKQDPSRQ